MKTKQEHESARPLHYGSKDDPYEAIKVIRAWGHDKCFYIGNVLKYICRLGKKDDELVELEKIRAYIDMKIEAIKVERGI